MTANIGSTVVTEPVQVTATLRPAEQGRSGYLVAATVGSRPPVAGHFEVPPTDGERGYEGTPPGADDRPVGAADAAAEVGIRLFEALFSGALRRCWAQAAEDARSRGLRLVINSPESPIHALPWELLFDRVLVNEHLALVDGWSILRAVPDAPTAPEPRPAPEVTVQVVTSRISGEPVVAAQLIQEGIPAASVRIRRGQSTTELDGLLREQMLDVLHIATGGVELPDGRQYLTLGDAASSDPMAVVVLVSATELLDMLRGVRRPSLVVLTGSDTEVLAAELAQLIPAVVGMRGDISEKGCERFLRGFYRALGRGESVEAGLAAGRAAQREFGSALEADWAAPVAYLSGPQRLITADVAAPPARDPAPAPRRSPGGAAPCDTPGGTSTDDRLGMQLRICRLDLAELLARWRPIDSTLWPEVVIRHRADLEAAIADATRQLGGTR